jgi:hypothetical protein
MKHFTFTRWLPWLLIALCPPLLGQCGGDVTHGTETGNPPVVEEQKLHIVLRETGVEVVGDPGAVSAGASFAVTNRTTGAHAEATAAADGSVNVVVPGTLQDEYDVTVSNAAGSQTVQITAQTSAATGGTGGSGSELASASCDSLIQTLSEQVTAAYSAASKACQADSDCTTGGDVGCYYGCGGPIVSTVGKLSAEAAIAQDTAPLCAELSQRCGPRGPPGCPFQTPATLACGNGTCQILSCDDLGQRAAAAVEDLAERAPRDCTVDTDCRVVSFRSDVSCVASCGEFNHSVATRVLEQLVQSALRVKDSFCTEFESRGCPPPLALPCLPPTSTPRAVCVTGQCDIQYVPLL